MTRTNSLTLFCALKRKRAERRLLAIVVDLIAVSLVLLAPFMLGDLIRATIALIK